jgi:hypothetical protein
MSFLRITSLLARTVAAQIPPRSPELPKVSSRAVAGPGSTSWKVGFLVFCDLVGKLVGCAELTGNVHGVDRRARCTLRPPLVLPWFLFLYRMFESHGTCYACIKNKVQNLTSIYEDNNGFGATVLSSWWICLRHLN